MATSKGARYWVVWDANANTIKIEQSATKPPDPQSGKVFGPYTTLAQAQAEANPNSSLFQQLALGASVGAGRVTGGEVGTVPNIPSPLAFLGYLGEIGHWLGVAVTDLSDPHLWISLGWLLLGLVLLVIGVVLWLKHEDLLPKAAPVPVPVPV